jgi:hypothetical protein
MTILDFAGTLFCARKIQPRAANFGSGRRLGLPEMSGAAA